MKDGGGGVQCGEATGERRPCVGKEEEADVWEVTRGQTQVMMSVGQEGSWGLVWPLLFLLLLLL